MQERHLNLRTSVSMTGTRLLLILAGLLCAPGTIRQSCTAAQASKGTGSKASSQILPKAASPSESGLTSSEIPDPGEDPNIYRIGAEDQLQISVWHEPELTVNLVVRTDGKITLPLVGDVYVAGQTPADLEVLLTKKLKSFVNDPQVTVIPQQIKSRKVSLVGQVLHQGSYLINSNITVVELIALGGGLGQFARAKSVYILRKRNGQEVKIPVNYKEAVRGRGDNPVLFPGDIVVVP